MNNQGISKKKKSTGTREWAKEYKNLISGCSNDCKSNLVQNLTFSA